ncbi:MAG: hypothetical protein CUN49_11320 [Candidatus Thermofonsia Clade 1 bacterium]|uniref:Glutathionylspermidine synthase pre-ATP-grasp-like domain-containing protein n=1 Tax=Candidatus Thermofonsia Clade 1 bacterium TaxID=2364210 RepID=A0A2M8PCK3_9CHLR|nr:MAG: hypothetical protein CUN49_11320 [Candidatus Thermofonsia Clade 1 bacterium]RMF50631.1 MAG: hypothetical protein D6749_10040 [Chloroflexota bacterium]
MIPELRERYNAAFTQARYQALVQDLNRAYRFPMDFHLCETPLFLSAPLMAALLAATDRLAQAVLSPEHLRRSLAAVPPELQHIQTAQPECLQVDFALCYDENGEIVPRLIELQGFPTLYGFQWLLDQKIRQHFEIDPSLYFYVAPHTEESYLRLLHQVIVADQEPQQVALLELYPERQRTRIDFACTEALLGIRTLCLTQVIERGERLFYIDERGRQVPIARFYNRLIFDDLSGEMLSKAQRLSQSTAVSWVSHPHWFFRISKYSLPLLRDPCVPEAHFLCDLDVYPPDLTANYVLKPLFSYSGSGVDLDPTPEKLDAIAPERRAAYLLQRKVDYAPLVKTPDGYAKAEVRMLLLWNAAQARLETVGTLVRMSKGRMMGTRFNKDRTWVGSTLAYHQRL